MKAPPLHSPKLKLRVCCLVAGEAGYPTSTLLPDVPTTQEEKTALVDDLQAWKTTAYQDLIGEPLLLTGRQCSAQCCARCRLLCG